MVLTNKQKFNLKHGLPKNKSHSIKSISNLSGYTEGSLRKVLSKGRGAFYSAPQSVRPNVRSEEQWAYARVNAFLVAVRTGKYRSGKFDRDLLPSGHPLKSDKKIG